MHGRLQRRFSYLFSSLRATKSTFCLLIWNLLLQEKIKAKIHKEFVTFSEKFPTFAFISILRSLAPSNLMILIKSWRTMSKNGKVQQLKFNNRKKKRCCKNFCVDEGEIAMKIIFFVCDKAWEGGAWHKNIFLHSFVAFWADFQALCNLFFASMISNHLMNFQPTKSAIFHACGIIKIIFDDYRVNKCCPCRQRMMERGDVGKLWVYELNDGNLLMLTHGQCLMT